METIQLPIQPEADLRKLDALIARLEQLEERGYKIPIQFVANIESLQAQLQQVAANAPKIAVAGGGLTAEMEEAGAFTQSLITKLKAVGESDAAAKLQQGFRSVASEISYLDKLYDEMTGKMRAAARNPQNLITGKIDEFDSIQNLIALRQSQLATVSRAAMEAPRDKAMFDQERSLREKMAKSGDAFVEQQKRIETVVPPATRFIQSQTAALQQMAVAQAQVAKGWPGGKLPPWAQPPGAGGARGGGGAGAGGGGGGAAGGGGLFGGLPNIPKTMASAAVFIGVYRALDEVVKALEFGIESAVKYERQLATLQIVFRGSREEARQLGLEVLQMAAAMGQSGTEALEVATDFARYGLTAAEVLEAVRASAMAANVAQLTFAESSKALQAIMSGYQVNAGQLVGILGSLDTVSHSYNVTNRQLLDGLSRVAPLAKQAGISLNELIGFEAVISGRTARPGAEAGNAIKALLSRVARPQVQSALSDVGVNVFDKQTGQLKEGTAIVNELAVAYANLSRGEQQELLVKIAGTQQASRIAALLDGYIKAQELAIDASRDVTRAERENIAIRQTLSSQLGTLTTQWQAFWVASAGSGSAAGLQGQLTDIVKSLSDTLGLLVLLQNYANKKNAAPGDSKPGQMMDVFLSSIPWAGIPAAARQGSRQIQSLKQAFGMKDEAEDAAKALADFNKQASAIGGAIEGDSRVIQLFQTITKMMATASPEKASAMIRAAAAVAEPGNLPAQQNLREQLEGLAKQGNYIELNARLLELVKKADADRTVQIEAQNKLFEEQIGKIQQEVEARKKLRDASERANRPEEVKALNKEIEDRQRMIEGLRRQQTGTIASLPEGDDLYASEMPNTDKIKQTAQGLAGDLAQIKASTREQELDKEATVARLTYELEKRQIDALVERGRVGRQVADQSLKDLQKERDETLENINMAREYARMIDGQARARREASLAGKSARSGEFEAQDIRRERESLSGIGRFGTGARREEITGIPLNIAAARQDVAGAKSPEERAAALARLQEFGARLEELGVDALGRKLQLEAEITREREKQTREASKNLLMADREAQLQAALAARLVQQRGGRGFSAEEFSFLDPKAKQAVERGLPSALPPEAQTRLSDLSRELVIAREELRNYQQTISLGKSIQAEANKALEDLLTKLQPSKKSAAASGISELAPDLSKSLDRGTALFQSSLSALGDVLQARDVAWSNMVKDLTATMSERLTRLERGGLRGAVGRAQGAVSA